MGSRREVGKKKKRGVMGGKGGKREVALPRKSREVETRRAGSRCVRSSRAW